MRVRSLLFAFFLLPAIGLAQLGFHLKPGQKRVKFPIEVVNNLIIVPVIINGQLPLKFILDTGVRTTILTEKAFSDILNLQYSRHYQVSGPGGEKLVEAYITNDVTLDLPGIHGQGHAMLVLEKDYLELRNYLGIDVQGILGYEVFSRFVVEIDYESRELTIVSPENYKIKNRYQSHDISIEDTKPYIELPVTFQSGNKMKVKLLVDTGASHALMLDHTSDPRIVIPEKHITSLIGRGLAGTISGKIARVKSVELGRFKLDGVVVSYPNPEDYGSPDSLKSIRVFRNGSVGGDLLRRFNIVFNFPMGKIYLKKNLYFSKNFNFNLSGLTFKAKGSRLSRFEITDVRKGSGADKADIRVGDELVAINGISAAQFSLSTLNQVFNVRPGRKVQLVLMREGQTVKKKITMISEI